MWGPAAPGIDEKERVARLRCLRALVRVLVGPDGRDVAAALRSAERDPSLTTSAVAAVEALPALHMRRVLSTYAALHTPEKP